MTAQPDSTKVLISGGGIAGLTLGLLLRQAGWDPLVIERDPALRTEGYMMDFFGTGWDVAERIGLSDEIRKVRYPIDYLEYVDSNGRPRFPPVPLERVRKAFDGKYTYLLRPDLEKILYDRALATGVPVRFGTTIGHFRDRGDCVEVTFADGESGDFRLVFGADGAHSRVRELAFGPESRFGRYLGYYVAEFEVTGHGREIGRSVKMYEEPGKVAGFYPVDDRRVQAMYIFRYPDAGHIPRDQRVAIVREAFRDAGWIAGPALDGIQSEKPVYFDSMAQIRMPAWQKGRIALLGDACGCLTPIAGQGSHMAMAGAYVIAGELDRYDGDHTRAFPAYEQFLRPVITKKQDEALRLARQFVPSSMSFLSFRYLLLRLIFSTLFIRRSVAMIGKKSSLEGYSFPVR
jgi:2-polyprenyl-6-methoxyphenol hydroxylase-like FAD-dependent oxidoreductase